MKRNKSIIILFYFFPLFLIGHLAYALIVREPYPSLMMPGFSKIDTDGKEYKLTDFNFIVQAGSKIDTVNLKNLAYPLSKIALSRAIDLAYFGNDSEKNYNSIQNKYYSIIKLFIGEKYYRKYIIAIRHPQLNKSQKDQFTRWVIKRISDNKNIYSFSVILEKILITRDYKSNSIIRKKVINQVKL
jgi:hypothetical protein|tara:strand:- start:6590 stop:7147 length:558 start_codon:yes stop_codon:yes gene_type:complete